MPAEFVSGVGGILPTEVTGIDIVEVTIPDVVKVGTFARSDAGGSIPSPEGKVTYNNYDCTHNYVTCSVCLHIFAQ